MQPCLHAQTLTHMIKTTSSRLFPLLFIGMTLAFASCSEDSNDPKYTSRCPRFSDVTCRSLSGGTVLQAGQPIVVTAVQRSQGKLLNGTTYEWSCEINDSTTHKKKQGLIYDYDKSDPRDTLIINEPGEYTICLEAKYNISGLYDGSVGTEKFSGGEVSYTTSPLNCFASLKKKFRVIAAPQTQE